MEIGLKAKVTPEVDDRAVRQEAGRLRSSFEDAVEDLEVAVDLSDVIDRVDSAQDHVEEMSTETHRAATGVSDMKDAMESMDLSALEQMQEGDFGMDVLFGDGPAQMAGGDQQQQADPGMLQQGMQSVLGGVGDRARGRTGRLAQGVNEKLDSTNSTLGRIGKGLLGGAAIIAIGGLALQYLSDTVDALASTSPLLETVVSMFGLAMSLFFRPFASMLGSMLLPIAASALKLAAEFNTVFGEEGIGDALAFLATEIVAGIVNSVLAVDIMGGLMDLGGAAIFGGDGEFGIQDAFRIAIIGAIGKVAIGRILSRGILSMLPRITAARLINVFAFPKLGTFIANRLGSTLMKASITEILEAGFRQLLQRAFGPVVANASFKTLWQAAFRTLMSKIPSLGIKAFLGRIFPSIGARGLISGILPKIGVRAILGRLLPSIGVRAILSKIGLMAVLRVLSGRLVYLIPVVGQIIGILDLLVFAITALIPGMKAFSPIMWTLTKVWDLLVWATMGLVDVIMWAVGGLADFADMLMSGSWIPDINISAAVGGMASGAKDILNGILETLGSIWTWFLSAVQPILDFLRPVFLLLGMFAAMGMEVWSLLMDGWNMLMGFLEDPAAALSGLFEGAMDLGSMAVDELIEGTIDIAEWIGGEAVDLWDWVSGGARDIWYWISGTSRDIWSWITNTSASIWDWVTGTTMSIWDFVASNTRELWFWILAVSRNIWFWITDVSADIWDWVTDSSEDIWNWVTDESEDIWNWVTDAMKQIWDFVTGAMREIWDFVTGATQAIWDFVTDSTMAIWDFVTDSTKAIWDYVTAATRSIWDFVRDTTQSIWDYVDSVTNSIWDWVNTPDINLRDYISIPNIDLGDYISVPDIDLGDANPLATGGVVSSPTIAKVGEGGEPEVVVPYSKLPGFVENMMAGMSPDQAIPGSVKKLAEGGIVTGPTFAMVGEGSESEAVLPLSRLQGMLSKPAMPSPPSSEQETGYNAPDQTVEATVDVSGLTGASDDEDDSSIADELEAALGDQLDMISASIDDLARKIQNSSLNGPIQITADGKVLAEVDAKGNDKYKKTRDVTK